MKLIQHKKLTDDEIEYFRNYKCQWDEFGEILKHFTYVNSEWIN